jgi:hypothetical protein
MKRLAALCVLVLLYVAPAEADVTITQTMTMEGKMAAAMGGATPQMVTRIKGMMSRTDIDVMGQSMASITDLTVPQFVLLNAATRTAQIFGPAAQPLPGKDVAFPKVDGSFKATGRKQVIEGANCEEHMFTMTADMAEMGAPGQMPAEAAAAMQDVRIAMNGSVWIATSGPGVAEYVRFQKAATDSKMLAAMTGIPAGQQGGGMERLMAAAAAAPGLPYLTEITMSFEGTGKAVEMMKMMGPITMTQRTTSVSTDPIPDELFKVPEGYTVEKP